MMIIMTLKIIIIVIVIVIIIIIIIALMECGNDSLRNRYAFFQIIIT